MVTQSPTQPATHMASWTTLKTSFAYCANSFLYKTHPVQSSVMQDMDKEGHLVEKGFPV